jgi:hypothetical protein
MIKLNTTNRRALTWIAVLIIAILVLGTASSGYVGAPIVIKQDLEGTFWDQAKRRMHAGTCEGCRVQPRWCPGRVVWRPRVGPQICDVRNLGLNYLTL